MNQKLKQLKIGPKWLVTVEFAINNKIYSATKVFLFIVDYGREMKMGADIRKKK